jgi:hypothetical protein
MVNRRTGLLEYQYDPQTGAFLRQSSPIRDIGAIWDVELLGKFLSRHELDPLIERSLRHFSQYLLRRDGYTVLDPSRLNEPSNIAHSALMTLALLHAPEPRDKTRIASLAGGILRQQRADGSYKIFFHDLPDEGEELYAGEAMLALLEAHRLLHEPQYLHSAESAFAHYRTEYYDRGRITPDMLVFFANWQAQACRLLFYLTADTSLREAVAAYVLDMHERIIDTGFYEDIERNPARQVSVEVACALEGLNDAYAVARVFDTRRAARFGPCICTGLSYLLKLQCPEDGAGRKKGGFGFSLTNRTQRIDIIGHAASTFMKSVENNIECRGTELE